MVKAEPSQRDLVVRLRNWVGDVVLCTPMLSRLEAAGYRLHLVGKPWAASLLAGFGWSFQRLGSTSGERTEQLQRWRREVARHGWGQAPFGPNALSLPYSFSSAWEMRRAGLSALGYDGEARALLLSRSLPRPRRGEGGHEMEVYWRLGQTLLHGAGPEAHEPPPAALGWRHAAEHRAQALSLMQAHGVGPGFVMLCPFAGGNYEGQDKRWPHFPAFAQQQLSALGRPVVVCPGPGEEHEAQQVYAPAGVQVWPGVSLGVCAALLEHAGLMVSNDTGPGHLAAAVGTPLLSVLGPTEPGHWGAWGPTVKVQRCWPRWPEPQDVLVSARAWMR